MRDWGYAKEYVEGMWRMMQTDHPDTYVLATGRTQSVRRFVELAFAQVDIDIEFVGTGQDEVGRRPKNRSRSVRVDKKHYRPAEVELLIGDLTKAKRELGWEAKTTLEGCARSWSRPIWSETQRDLYSKPALSRARTASLHCNASSKQRPTRWATFAQSNRLARTRPSSLSRCRRVVSERTDNNLFARSSTSRGLK